MGSYKNQHFVPRCYLRAFSHQRVGLAINLFNLDRRRAINNAPLKGQCSGDYFYGEDLVVERALQAFEGQYATMLAEIVRPGYRLTAQHRKQLTEFCCLQYMRTEAASRRAVAAIDEINDDVGMTDAAFRMTIREAVQTAMSLFLEVRHAMVDLKVCLVRNQTPLPFITSDDPSVLTNRWYQQDARARGTAPGLGSAGALLLLPLSPDLLCLVYDGGVYAVPNSYGWVIADRVDDIAAYNEHQFLNAFANVYFQDWGSRIQLSAAFTAVADRRPAARHRINHAIFDREENGQRIFRGVDAAEARLHETSLVHQEAIFPIPTRWPRHIGWRPDGVVYSNGSGAGYSRRATIPSDGGDYRRLRSRRR